MSSKLGILQQKPHRYIVMILETQILMVDLYCFSILVFIYALEVFVRHPFKSLGSSSVTEDFMTFEGFVTQLKLYLKVIFFWNNWLHSISTYRIQKYLNKCSDCPPLMIKSFNYVNRCFISFWVGITIKLLISKIKFMSRKSVCDFRTSLHNRSQWSQTSQSVLNVVGFFNSIFIIMTPQNAFYVSPSWE